MPIITLQQNIEIWEPVVGYEGLYEVSSLGNVRSLDRIVTGKCNSKRKINSKILRREHLSGRYYAISLSKDNKIRQLQLSRIVAIAFTPNPKRLGEVNHIDGDKKNNKKDNLKWCNRSENMIHAVKIGLVNSGSMAYQVKLTEEIVKDIRKNYKKLNKKSIFSTRAIARRYRVCQGTINDLLKYRTWKYI